MGSEAILKFKVILEKEILLAYRIMCLPPPPASDAEGWLLGASDDEAERLHVSLSVTSSQVVPSPA